MTNPGPPGRDERGLAASEPVVPEGDPLADPLAADPLTADVPPSPPVASPAPAAFEPVSDSPVYDEVVSRTDEFATIGSGADAFSATGTTGADEFSTIGDSGGAVFGDVREPAGGPLGAVKAFAAQRPQVFLGVALAVGFLLGRVLSSSDDEES